VPSRWKQGIQEECLPLEGSLLPNNTNFVTSRVDHYSRYIFPTFHVSKDTTEMLKSKQCFEDFAHCFDVSIKSIHADNGVYASTAFQQSYTEQHQTFCAVGGHWQNGVIEYHIGMVANTVCTILLHAMEKWPTVITEEFWPFAVRHACMFHNSSIWSDTKQSPHRMFTGEDAPWKLEHFRVFGSPSLF
jgi:hypothetical protein